MQTTIQNLRQASHVILPGKHYCGRGCEERGGLLKIMAGFDDPGVFYSDPLYSEDGQSEAADESNTAVQKKFYDFLRTFMDDTNVYCYR